MSSAPDPKAELKELARDRLIMLEDQLGPVVGLPPFHSRMLGFDPENRQPVYAVCDRTAAHAFEVALDPISAQLVAWAATHRAGVTPIACLWSPL